MRDELQKSLRDRYPLIFRSVPPPRDLCGPAPDPFPVWGFECGDGWFDLLDARRLWDPKNYRYDGEVRIRGVGRRILSVYIPNG